MNKYILGIISIIIIIIASIFILISNQDQTNEKEIVEEINKTEFLPGDFRIDKTQYNIGEKIFLDMDYIGSGDKGTVYILRPLNDTHRITYMMIPFNGENKDSFNYYFEAKWGRDKWKYTEVSGGEAWSDHYKEMGQRTTWTLSLNGKKVDTGKFVGLGYTMGDDNAIDAIKGYLAQKK